MYCSEEFERLFIWYKGEAVDYGKLMPSTIGISANNL